MPGTGSSFLDKPGSEENLEVLGNGGAADGELRRQLTDGARLLGHQLEDPPTGRIGQCDQSVSNHLP